tara:strand:+ start:5831 stop:7516 length:1686 start_codon:yes stop_codon:yes gene_type:complete
MTQLQVDLKGYYENMIKGQWSFEDAFNEQPHNTFDNGGTLLHISLCNDKGEKMVVEEKNKDHKYGIIKNPSLLIYKDNCGNHLKNPEKIMKTLSEKVKHKGVGHFNLGEIGSIFNLGTKCIYLTPDETFQIEENLSGFPELSYLSENKRFELIKKYNLDDPKRGTLKLFFLYKRNIQVEYLRNIAKKTSVQIVFENESEILQPYNFNYHHLLSTYNYKDSVTVYGYWNNTLKLIDFYMKYEQMSIGGKKMCYLKMKNKIERFPSNPLVVAKEFEKYFFENKYDKNNIVKNADLRVTFKTSLYPFGENKSKKDKNEQGMIHLFQNETNGWVMLHNQQQCEKFAEYTIPYYSKKSKVNGVWRGLESISHFQILKTDFKNEILEQMGFFPIKSKGKNLYECHEFRNIARIIFEKQIEYFGILRKKDGGGDKWDNITVDENNVWRNSKNEIMNNTNNYNVSEHKRTIVNRDDVIESLEYLEEKINDYGICSNETIILMDSLHRAFYSNALGVKSEDLDCMKEDKPEILLDKIKFWYLKKYKKNIKAKGGSEIKRIEELERTKDFS